MLHTNTNSDAISSRFTRLSLFICILKSCHVFYSHAQGKTHGPMLYGRTLYSLCLCLSVVLLLSSFVFSMCLSRPVACRIFFSGLACLCMLSPFSTIILCESEFAADSKFPLLLLRRVLTQCSAGCVFILFFLQIFSLCPQSLFTFRCFVFGSTILYVY